MDELLETKLNALRNRLESTGGCAVAYSGGVDSTLLVAVAGEALGDRALAVIATSSTYPKREYESAIEWIKSAGVPYISIISEELDIAGFADNPPNRCYYCKKELFGKVWEEARKRGLNAVADGSNADDVNDFRPGMTAAKELGVISPLKECGLTKADIRQISKEIYNLPTADKPATACMSSRFPYGSQITGKKLNQVEEVEDFLYNNGLREFRARHHGDLVRLELGPSEMRLLQQDTLKEQVIQAAKAAGFIYITIDLQGFRSGSMNEVLLPREQGIGNRE